MRRKGRNEACFGILIPPGAGANYRWRARRGVSQHWMKFDDGVSLSLLMHTEPYINQPAVLLYPRCHTYVQATMSTGDQDSGPLMRGTSGARAGGKGSQQQQLFHETRRCCLWYAAWWWWWLHSRCGVEMALSVRVACK